ncbi:MAG: hypothetical protein IPJ89_04200 [Candidatus Iainarchaeum archaeon]|uniref:Methyltransferase domain-containing protein n=1 Tax=Candidatus Iainarchaeum sp. TaxID=3101447 RepID=A0A7T9I0V7_9ARCH|nr:MAG: hypothetical protein IPJ89_04200 [Candidatus Diapherotrites archaeon]
MMSIPVMKTFTENLHQLCIDFQQNVKESEHPSIDKKVQLSAETLEQFLLTQQFTPIQENTLLKLDSIAQLVPQTQAAYRYYQEDLERSYAQELVANNESELDFTHSHLRREGLLASKEAHFSNLSEHDRVLVIGTGYFPLHAMVYAGQFNAKVIGLETQQHVREHATRVVESMEMGNQIKIQDIRNLYAQAAKANVIFVSRDMNDKVPLINSLAEHLKPGTRVMCRTGFGLRAMLHAHVPHKQLQGFTQMGVLDAGKSSLQSSLCLLR